MRGATQNLMCDDRLKTWYSELKQIYISSLISPCTEIKCMVNVFEYSNPFTKVYPSISRIYSWPSRCFKSTSFLIKQICASGPLDLMKIWFVLDVQLTLGVN